MERELRARGIPFEAQKPISVRYKGQPLQKHYFADLLCFRHVLVELKALNRLSGDEQAQILNYLKATGIRVGLLISFAAPANLNGRGSSTDSPNVPSCPLRAPSCP